MCMSRQRFGSEGERGLGEREGRVAVIGFLLALAASLVLPSVGAADDTSSNAGDWGNFEVGSAAAPRPPRVYARFDLSSVSGAPFPSDLYAVADAGSRTGRRVNMPLPGCTTHPSDCNDLAVVNTMDGFNLLTSISIPFDV